MRLLITSLAILLGFLVSSTRPVFADTVKSKKLCVTIPVIYVTDRAAKKGGYGPQRKFETIESIDCLHCGWLDYSLPAVQAISEQQKQLGWSDSLSHSEVFKTRQLTEVKNYHDFGPVVIDAAKKSGTNSVFVMVHGFNTPFASAAKGAALLAQRVQCPVILYSWPSKGKLGQYNVDLGNNEWSQEHFDALLEELKVVKDSSGLKFNLLAHSMGNRLIVRSAPVLQGKHLFSDMFLVDPDFDAETFVHYLVRYGRKKDEPEKAADKIVVAADTAADQAADKAADKAAGSAAVKAAGSAAVKAADNASQVAESIEPTKVRILFSHKDHALPLSEFLSGGYTRLGQAADSLLSTVVAPYTIPGKIGEVFNPDDTRDVTDRINSQASTWLMNFQWIDYTILDHGMLGHTVPFELIANLWSTNLPGEGLKLVHSDNGAPNKLARFFTHIFGESDHISSKIDSSEKVVFATESKTATKHH